MTKRLTTDKFIEKAKKIHGELYDYSKFKYINSKIKSIIICPIHGEFSMNAHDHFIGRECLKCAIKKRSKFRINKCSGDFFIKSNIKHKNKYDYSKFEYLGCEIKGIIICPIHGKFWQTPNNHMNCSQGCPKCSNEKIKIKLKFDKSKIVKRAIKLYGLKYDYSEIDYVNMYVKIGIICSRHGKFWQTPNNHLYGHECPKCNNIISKSESEFLNYLNIPDTQKNRQLLIERKKVDGYDDKTNTVYEFLGDYWHGNPTKFIPTDYNKRCHKTFGELHIGTFNRFKILKSLGYNVKYIWENDWKRFKRKETDILHIINF